jgi:hypothetical protein
MESKFEVPRYCREAEDCRRNAEQARNPIDRAAWLRLAEDWMKLARGAELNCALQAMRERSGKVTRH